MVTIGIAVFQSVVFATFFNNARQWYARFQTYPLFAWVGKAEFRPFHGEYDRLRLPRAVPHYPRNGLDGLARPNTPRLTHLTASSAIVFILSARVLAT